VTFRSSARETAGPTRQHHKPRRYRRFPLDARVAVYRSGQPRPYPGRSLGISEAGISALLALDVEVGECVSLKFTLPGSAHRLEVRAVVRNRSGARYGFEFLTLSEQQRSAISEYCDGQAD